MKNKSKARTSTLGPWGIEQTTSNNWIGPMRSDGIKVSEIVCSTERGPDFKPTSRAKSDANARLIAASPDLVYACRIALSYILGGKVEREPLIQLLDAAITKAGQ